VAVVVSSSGGCGAPGGEPVVVNVVVGAPLPNGGNGGSGRVVNAPPQTGGVRDAPSPGCAPTVVVVVVVVVAVSSGGHWSCTNVSGSAPVMVAVAVRC
jgi:hypothetical protein